MAKKTLITRVAAKRVGLKRYFTGRKCKFGHTTERLVSNFCCVACHNLKVAALRRIRISKYPERERLRQKLKRQRNLKTGRARSRRYYWRHKDKESKRRHLYDQKHPEKGRLRVALRHARKVGAEGRYTSRDIAKILVRQRTRCVGVGCNKNLKMGYHIDHKTPLSRGGSNWPHNLQLLCAKCNCSKGTKTQYEWEEQEGV